MNEGEEEGVGMTSFLNIKKFIFMIAVCSPLLGTPLWAGYSESGEGSSSQLSEVGSTVDELYVQTTHELINDETPLYGAAGTIGDNGSYYKETKKSKDRESLAHLDKPGPLETKESFSIEEGSAALASWYGPGFNGRKTCTGERFNQNAFTLAAHRWVGQTVCVAYGAKRITAKVNDCGPYEKTRRGKWVPHSKRSFDLSKGLMRALAGKAKGLIDVSITPGAC
jgi:rare lipoprotein A